ncbi:MAG: pentapeptide repeat-containing protein [Tagaea sp.]
MPGALDYTWFWLLANAADLRDLMLAAAAFAVLPFLAWRSWVARRLAEAQRKSAEAIELGRAAEIMAQAFAGLGADKVQVRMGAIYSLERQARERPKDQGPIVQTLAAFVRDACPAPAAPVTAESVYRAIQVDVQAALGVLGRRARGNDPPGLRLSFAGANLSGYDFADGDFTGASFKGAYICAANFAGAKLRRSDFHLVVADQADFYGADARETSFSAAYCGWARFAHADVTGAVFAGADLRNADFAHARVDAADWRDAMLDGAALPAKALPKA